MILLWKSSKFSYSNIWSLLCPCKRKLSLNYYLLQKVLFSLYIFIICSGHQCILSMNLPHCVCASFIFSCYMKSLHYIRVKKWHHVNDTSTRRKNLLHTCKKWQQHDAICYACLHVHKKFAYWPWSWHLFRSPWPSFCMLAFLCTALISQELMKKRSLKKAFLLAFLCLCAKNLHFHLEHSFRSRHATYV